MYDSNQYPIGQQRLFPQEEMLEIRKSRKQLSIGIPAENQKLKTGLRLHLRQLNLLCSLGHRIIIERGAGDGCKL